MFFQWRASQAGAEKYHSAMLPHAGTDSRTWREVTGLGAELGSLDELVGSRVQADVAILFDWNSWWALELGGKPSDLRLMPHVRAWYAALFERNLTVDFVHPGADLTRYRVLIAPLLYLVDDESARNIGDWVAGGGTLLMSFFSGIVDRDEHVRLGGYPASFREVLGLHVEEFAPLQATDSTTVRTVDGQSLVANTWVDLIRTEGAHVLATYMNDWFADQPAITEHAHGKGRALYVGTALDPTGRAWALERACRSAGVRGRELPHGVESVSRTDGERRWRVLLNHSDESAEVALDDPGVEVLSARAVTGSISVNPRDVAIVRSPA
jgi:beta-galactosidase